MVYIGENKGKQLNLDEIINVYRWYSKSSIGAECVVTVTNLGLILLSWYNFVEWARFRSGASSIFRKDSSLLSWLIRPLLGIWEDPHVGDPVYYCRKCITLNMPDILSQIMITLYYVISGCILVYLSVWRYKLSQKHIVRTSCINWEINKWKLISTEEVTRTWITSPRIGLEATSKHKRCYVQY